MSLILPALAIFLKVWIDFWIVFLSFYFSICPIVRMCTWLCVCILWVAHRGEYFLTVLGLWVSVFNNRIVFRLRTSPNCCLSWMFTTWDGGLSLWPHTQNYSTSPLFAVFRFQMLLVTYINAVLAERHLKVKSELVDKKVMVWICRWVNHKINTNYSFNHYSVFNYFSLLS